VIRVLVHYYATDDHQPRHVYLGEARSLRTDLQSAQ
jgi:chorismate mutase